MYRSLLVAVVLLFAAPSAFAVEQCFVEIEGNDRMQFNLETIEISKACQEFTITLKHVGTLARNVMGHNVVVAATEDMDDVNRDGMQAGLESNYVKPDDPRVIAYTKVVGGGETASVTFDPSRLKDGVSYSFFCSFPGHAAMMNGLVKWLP
ncbi:MAG TPA: azurin [Gammaproteobacteria bacterium]